MNYLYNLKLDQFRSNESTIPIQYFFKKFEIEKNRKTCKKVEEIINNATKENVKEVKYTYSNRYFMTLVILIFF